MAFILESPAFSDGGEIPRKHIRSGDNLSPPLAWRGAPPGTKSFVLIVEDPDAPSGTFRHWAVYNIDGQRSHLPEGTAAGAKTESLGRTSMISAMPITTDRSRPGATASTTTTSGSGRWMSRRFVSRRRPGSKRCGRRRSLISSEKPSW